MLYPAYLRDKRHIAFLVDEYDAPLLSTIDNEPLHNSFRETLKSLFSVANRMNEFIYFEFVTGVSRFSHTSLFSGANNLDDITMVDEYAGICGISEQELTANLMPGIQSYAEAEEISETEALTQFKRNYELKVDKTASEALDQINEKQYHNPWMQSGKTIIKIGANYSSATNNIDSWEIEEPATQML